MNYETFYPHPDLESLVKCYWTLEVPFDKNSPKQRIVPDGCIEMIFMLGDDVRRYITEEEFIIQPRTMVIGQITEPFLIQPVGHVHTFAVRFYPYGFANFAATTIKHLANKETPINQLFGDDLAHKLEHEIVNASTTKQRIEIAEEFLLQRLNSQYRSVKSYLFGRK